MSLSEYLSKIYFGPGGFMPVKKLHELILKEYPDTKLSEVKDWVDKQTINQVTHKSVNEQGAKHGHFFVTKPNELHQADILYFPQDKRRYKYVLCVVSKIFKNRKVRINSAALMRHFCEYNDECCEIFYPEFLDTLVEFQRPSHRISTARMEMAA